ncbi:MAG: transporter substrate-binding domain-containing protein [Candidatus Delongbacteria bacterium]|nr:transporter substrate-binding domain-containing protein [Candidatus Delongbacteria bacterium]MBN2836578.1 transporter substrate-binding domain-containing protein [Candidatus Delongbacteria bacterium]
MLKVILFMIIMLFENLFSIAKISAAADPWPPFIDPENPTGGFALEIIRAAYYTQGYEVEMNFVPWVRAEEGVKSGKYDILTTTWYTEKRSHYFKFSKPYYVNKVKFIKRVEDDFEYSGESSLQGKIIGVIRGYGYNDNFAESKLYTLDPVSDFHQNILKLLFKRIDLTLEDELVAKFLLMKNNPDLLNSLSFVSNPINLSPLHVTSGLSNKKSESYIDAFNKGLEIIEKNGEYDRILKKYELKK